MNTVQLSEMLTQTTYAIDAYHRGERISRGAGVCIHDAGFLATAAHVVTGREPIRKEDWKDPELSIWAHTFRGEFIEYEPVVCGIDISFPGPLKQPLQVDVALLRPAAPTERGFKYLEVGRDRYPVGTQVLMAGFPDELVVPLMWTNAINYDHPPIKETEEETRRKVDLVEQLLMIKSGMIGYSDYLDLDRDGSGQSLLNIGVYYIDNAMHSGASGGPIVNALGQVAGIITKRAVTIVSYEDLPSPIKPNKEVPSGSTLAISAYTLVDFINRHTTAMD